MITYESLAGIPEMVAQMPVSVWIAATILAVLCAVIALRLYLQRKPSAKRSSDMPEEQFWFEIFFGTDISDAADRCDGKCDEGHHSGEKRSGYSKEHVP